MLTKTQKKLQRQWIRGSFDLSRVARRLGYRGNRLSKGMQHIRAIMDDMHLAI